MAEQNLTLTPHLTLSPDLNEKTPVAEAVDTLEVDSTLEATSAVCQEFARLSEEEQAMVQTFSEQIDITDATAVLQYGTAAQKHIADFSSSTLNNIRTKDMGEVGNMLSNLTVELRGFNFDDDEKKGVRGLFKRARNRFEMLKAQYDHVEANVDKIVGVLQAHQVTLLKDISMLDKMYDLNAGYFKELTMYILAGKQKLQYVLDNDFKALQEKAIETELPEDAQNANDFANMCNRFEKKIHDLELTRMVSINMAPQIRMIQNNDALMLEKIQTSIMNTIPLWKSQMVLALSLHHSQQAMQAQRSVNDTTNELLRKNAEALKTGTVEIAKESERGIVDLETLQYTNQNLIKTLEEVHQIQVEGSKRRNEASQELVKIESELKKKLLEVIDHR
jgi:uncharacterized protein YaaN involved in tellurite resistance